MGLEAHDVVDRPLRVVPPQLDHRVGIPPRPRVGQPHGLHRPVAHRVLPAAGHDLDGHAALEHAAVVEAVHLRLLGGAQLLTERLILLLGHRAVDIIRRPLVVPGREIRAVHVDALEGHDRGGRVVEIQRGPLRVEGGQFLRQRVGREGPGRDDHAALRDVRHLRLRHGDEGMALDALRHGVGKSRAVHGQGSARRHAVRVGAAHDQAPHPAHLLLQKADRVGQVVPPEGVGAHQFGKAVGHVGRGAFRRLHLDQFHGHAADRQLPGGLAAGQAGADHLNRHCRHCSFSSGPRSRPSVRPSFPRTRSSSRRSSSRRRPSSGGIRRAFPRGRSSRTPR